MATSVTGRQPNLQSEGNKEQAGGPRVVIGGLLSQEVRAKLQKRPTPSPLGQAGHCSEADNDTTAPTVRVCFYVRINLQLSQSESNIQGFSLSITKLSSEQMLYPLVTRHIAVLTRQAYHTHPNRNTQFGK